MKLITQIQIWLRWRSKHHCASFSSSAFIERDQTGISWRVIHFKLRWRSFICQKAAFRADPASVTCWPISRFLHIVFYWIIALVVCDVNCLFQVQLHLKKKTLLNLLSFKKKKNLLVRRIKTFWSSGQTEETSDSLTVWHLIRFILRLNLFDSVTQEGQQHCFSEYRKNF